MSPDSSEFGAGSSFNPKSHDFGYKKILTRTRIIVKVQCFLRRACALGSRDNWRIEFRPFGNDSKLPFEAPNKLLRWLQVVDSRKLKLVSIQNGSSKSGSSDMLKKLMLSVVACSMIFVAGSHHASARVKDCCSPCQVVKVHKVRCPKPKCVRPHHNACCTTPVAACASGCGHAAETQHMVPVPEHGPMPSTVAPVEAAPAEAAPSPSAADAPK